jgi:hypothetical protein
MTTTRTHFTFRIDTGLLTAKPSLSTSPAFKTIRLRSLPILPRAKVTRGDGVCEVKNYCFRQVLRDILVRNASRILVFRAGRVIESGPFDELIQRDGHFAELARSQFMAREPTKKRHARAVGQRAET